MTSRSFWSRSLFARSARPLPNDELRRVVIESARTFSQMGIDVLKTPFPLDVAHEPDEAVWRAALAELNEACRVPWALLSAGVDYPTFRRQAELACEAGASGVIAGRAIWAGQWLCRRGEAFWPVRPRPHGRAGGDRPTAGPSGRPGACP